MTIGSVICSIEDGVATITLNNPPLNLVTLELTHALNDTLARLAADPAVRALVLTGSGDCVNRSVSTQPATHDERFGQGQRGGVGGSAPSAPAPTSRSSRR